MIECGIHPWDIPSDPNIHRYQPYYSQYTKVYGGIYHLSATHNATHDL